MCGSVEEKSKYKEQLVPWIIGATMVFAITTIPSIIYDLTSSVTSIPDEVGQNGGTHSDFMRGHDEAVLNIAYAKLGNYKSEESDGSGKIIKYDIPAFVAYLDKELEANKTKFQVSKNKYYNGICEGINAVKNRAGDINKLIQYAEGYKEAVYEINTGKVTKKNINEALEAAEADRYFYEGKIEEEKYDAKKVRLQNQKNIYIMEE